MEEIVPHLWIGDLACALSTDYLARGGVTHVVTAMKSRLPVPPVLDDGRSIAPENTMHVRIDDVETAPLLVHFASSNDFIDKVLQEVWNPVEEDDQGSDVVERRVDGKLQRGYWNPQGEGVVLVHCQAGISRSVALVAAYLMWRRQLTASEAMDLIKSRRSQADPNSGFRAQLDLYESVSYDVDLRHQPIRRFLMSQTDILNGDSVDDLLLSYYPSPYPSPALSISRRADFGMTSTSEGDAAPMARGRKSSNASAASQSRPNSISPRSRSNSELSQHASELSQSPPLEDGVAALHDELYDADADESNSCTSGAEPPNAVASKFTTSSIGESYEVKVTQNSGRLPGGVASLRGNEGRTNAGALPNPTFQGPKLRCKSCRRELAAWDHVVDHEPGKGRLAFEHRKRGAADTQSIARFPKQDIEPHPSEAKFGARRGSSTAAKDSEDSGEKTLQNGQEEAATEANGSTAGAPVSNASGHSEGDTSLPAPPVSAAPKFKSAAALASSLPPHLAALRMGRTSSSSSKGPSVATPNSSAAGKARMLHSSACSSYFLEPLHWMTALRDGDVSGRLDCPTQRCSAKLGAWDWAGSQCGCGAWVTPAFALHRSKVDEI